MKAIFIILKTLLAIALFLGAMLSIAIIFGEPADDSMSFLYFMGMKAVAMFAIYVIYKIGDKVFPWFFAELHED